MKLHVLPPQRPSPPRSASRDEQVAGALDAMANGSHAATEDLYDLLGQSVYALALLVTADQESAEAVTVEAFGRLWRAAPVAPGDPLQASRPVLDVACGVAHEYVSRQGSPDVGSSRLTPELAWEQPS